MENYRFGKIVCSVIATEENVVVQTNHPFTLILNGKRHQVKKGENIFNIKNLVKKLKIPPCASEKDLINYVLVRPKG